MKTVANNRFLSWLIGPIAGPIAGGFFGIIFFYIVVGLDVLNPLNISWLTTNDYAQHYLGWLAYRHAPVNNFPLGGFDLLAHPIGGNLAATDSIPWLAITLSLFSGFLPATFQYQGIWLATCFFLQGFFGFKIASLGVRSRLIPFYSSLFFLSSPVLIGRLYHLTLMSQWIILWSIYLYLIEHWSIRKDRCEISWACVISLSAATHPYILAMVLVIRMGTLVQRLLTGYKSSSIIISAVLSLLFALFFLYAFGFFTIGTLAAPGFGLWSSDVLALLIPWNLGGNSSLFLSSTIRPELEGPQLVEGYGYLGLGVIFLVILTSFWSNPKPKASTNVCIHWWFGLVFSALIGFFYSLSSIITIFGHEVINIQDFYALLFPEGNPFRASGRFIWITHYVVITLTIIFIASIVSIRIAHIIIGFALLIQIIDLSPILQQPLPRGESETWSSEIEDQLNRFSHHEIKHIVLYPPSYHIPVWRFHQEIIPKDYRSELVASFSEQRFQNKIGCYSDLYSQNYYASYAKIALENNYTINSAYFARNKWSDISNYCKSLFSASEQLLDDQSLYVVYKPYMGYFLWQHDFPESCYEGTESYYCFSRKNYSPVEKNKTDFDLQSISFNFDSDKKLLSSFINDSNGFRYSQLGLEIIEKESLKSESNLIFKYPFPNESFVINIGLFYKGQGIKSILFSIGDIKNICELREGFNQCNLEFINQVHLNEQELRTLAITTKSDSPQISKIWINSLTLEFFY